MDTNSGSCVIRIRSGSYASNLSSMRTIGCFHMNSRLGEKSYQPYNFALPTRIGRPAKVARDLNLCILRLRVSQDLVLTIRTACGFDQHELVWPTLAD